MQAAVITARLVIVLSLHRPSGLGISQRVLPAPKNTPAVLSPLLRWPPRAATGPEAGGRWANLSACFPPMGVVRATACKSFCEGHSLSPQAFTVCPQCASPVLGIEPGSRQSPCGADILVGRGQRVVYCRHSKSDRCTSGAQQDCDFSHGDCVCPCVCAGVLSACLVCPWAVQHKKHPSQVLACHGALAHAVPAP